MLVYTDASALVKLVRDEAKSGALRTYVRGADLISSAIVLSEVPRAVRRAAADDASLPAELLLARAAAVLDATARVPVDELLLVSAGAIEEPGLRALDAIHVAAALSIAPIDAFVSYDQRQSAAARLAGLRTVAPG